MIRIDAITESFRNLVGWEQGKAPLAISDMLTQSESGLYFQEAHPLLTLRAMNGIKPEGTTLSEYLYKLTERGIKKVVTRFAQDKVILKESRGVLPERRTLFDGAGRKESRVENSGKLVGFEITPIRSMGVTMVINKIGCQFVGNIGEVKFYLFHSSKMEPVATKVVNYNAERGSFMWFDVNDWVLPYITKSTNAGGSWYIVYNQRALPPYMEAINFGRDWSREPCGTCNKGDAVLYRTMLKYVQISPFYVAIDENWDETLWDVDDMMYSMGNNYGINLLFTMNCDATDSIINMKRDFASAVQLQVAHEALRALALNPEVAVNRLQYNADRDQILFETDGNGQGIKGLKGELEKAYKALELDTRGIDPICLGCHNKGISYRSV